MSVLPPLSPGRGLHRSPVLESEGSSQSTLSDLHPSTSSANETKTTTILQTYPSELLDSLLDSVPASQLQSTAFSLMQVFPTMPISESHLFKHLKVTRPEQLKPMWMRLRKDSHEDASIMGKSVKSFTMGCFRGDADLMNNILRLLMNLEVMLINLGTNCAPDHLTELLENHRPTLRRAEFRFRPYVDKASYYQFLKGSYFDTAIDSLIKNWTPTPSFTHLSLVQDIPPRFSVPHLAKLLERKKKRLALMATSNPGSAMHSSEESAEEEELPDDVLQDAVAVEPRGYTGHGPFPYVSEKLAYTKPKTFAQPIVFFDIRCLLRLALSDAARYITHLRLRVPCRDIAAVLSEGVDPSVGRKCFPKLKFLDLSTTNVRSDGWLPSLLKRYDRIEHLILDRTNLFGFQGKDSGPEMCMDLGRMMVMVGMTKSKERERELGVWDLNERTRMARAELEASRRAPPPRERRGSGSASEEEYDEDGNLVIRERQETPATPSQPESTPFHMRRAIGQTRRGHRSIANASFSIRDRPNRRGQRSDANADADLVIPPANTVCMVLPALPILQSVSIGGEGGKNSTPESLAAWDRQFQEGWRDGLHKISDWAMRIGERYDRACKVADQWRDQEEAERLKSVKGKAAGGSSSKSKASGPSSSATAAKKPKPPLDIRLYRYPRLDEPVPEADFDQDLTDPAVGLILIDSQDDWRSTYQSFLSDADAWSAAAQAKDQARAGSSSTGVDVVGLKPPQVILCTVPDCEGPMRRGDGGEREDGRSGLGGEHVTGCGHLLARQIWGWET